MKKYDLHIHSNFSDGNYSIEEIVDKVKDAGIDIFSITDHDNIESIKKRFTVMANETEPNLANLKKYAPVHRIKADQPIEKVFEDIDVILKPLLKVRTTPLKK